MELIQNGISIKADILHVGDDILVVVQGGDKPHIGSCMLNEKTLTLPHHKDDIALNVIYETLKKHTDKNICLVGGIHVKNITKEQIQTVLFTCKKLALKLANEIKKSF